MDEYEFNNDTPNARINNPEEEEEKEEPSEDYKYKYRPASMNSRLQGQ